MNPLLQVKHLQTYYGECQVLFDISLEVGHGEIVSLLGRNGMGKTTTVRSIMGLLRPANGSVLLQGEPIDKRSADQIARLGIGLVPEGRQIFPNLTVEENLRAFAANRKQSTSPWTLAKVYEIFPRLNERRNNMGNQLSGGEQQMLAIGRALMTNAKLLIIDEATEGLAPLIREEIWKCLSYLRDEGQSILVIDKYVERLIPLANRHYIIEGGSIMWEGSSEQLKQDKRLWQRYLGV